MENKLYHAILFSFSFPSISVTLLGSLSLMPMTKSISGLLKFGKFMSDLRVEALERETKTLQLKGILPSVLIPILPTTLDAFLGLRPCLLSACDYSHSICPSLPAAAAASLFPEIGFQMESVDSLLLSQKELYFLPSFTQERVLKLDLKRK